MNILTFISDAVWGAPTVILILGTGIYLTVSLGFPQIFRLREILSSPERKSFRSFTTALAATVGTGSVAGVGAAIALGGPGAVFWLWVSAFFGMASAYREGYLSIKFRRENPRRGGIWYALKDGAGSPVLAAVYAAFCVLASFGMGCMAQTSAASGALKDEFGVSPLAAGIFLTLLLTACLISEKFTGRLCGIFIPVLSAIYIAGAGIIILKNISALPGVLKEIFSCAFGLKPAIGGAAGYTVKRAISVGCRRGVFSNEAGLGTTAPVHAASDLTNPDRQGLMNMLEVIIDSFVICTLTALAILCSGAEYTGTDGTELAVSAAQTVFGGMSAKLVAVSMAAFATATAVGWSVIGCAAAEYLSPGLRVIYRIIFAAAAFLGSQTAPGAVFAISDIFNGLMAFPCVAALVSGVKDPQESG